MIAGWQSLTPVALDDNNSVMSANTTLNVSLTPELEAFIKSRVDSGRYLSSSEVVREGLRLLQRDERAYDEELADLKAKLKRSIEQADRGEVVDGESVFAEIRERLHAGKGAR